MVAPGGTGSLLVASAISAKRRGDDDAWDPTNVYQGDQYIRPLQHVDA